MKHIYYRWSVPDSEYEELKEAMGYGLKYFLMAVDVLHGTEDLEEGEYEDPSVRH